MDRFDINTRLPPRKRLLAGLRKESSDRHFPPPVPPILHDLDARICALFSSTTASPEEIIEASRSAALAAAEVAAKARATAMEKACAAAKARAAAKSALELLESIATNDAHKDVCAIKTKYRKKHVPIKLLYKNNQPVEIRETDEELALRLHHAMNSSPRISSNSHKKRGNSPVLCDSDVQLMNGCSKGKFEENILVCSKADLFESEGGCDYMEIHHVGSRDRATPGGKKAKNKRKKLPLSQCSIRDRGNPRDEALTGEPKSDCAERNMPLNDAEGDVSMKIASVWKCKKFKVPQRSDSKILHALYSNASTRTAAMVKVD